jgi:UDP-N-acetyl-D-mannosaminuronate dehydrogenase
MKRYAVVLAALLCVTAVTVAIVNRLADSEPTYTVAQVQAGLLHYRRAWVGRTVLVHGILYRGSYMGSCLANASCAVYAPGPR